MTGYPLATLLVLRTRCEEEARLALARALASEGLRRAEADAAAGSAAAHAARLDRAVRALAAGEGATAGTLPSRARYAERLRREAAALAEDVRRAAAALRAAACEVDARRAALAEARGAVRALERHRDGWRAEESRKRERREEAAADDVSARRAAP